MTMTLFEEYLLMIVLIGILGAFFVMLLTLVVRVWRDINDMDKML